MKIPKASRNAKTLYKCRCCPHPSNNFLELETPTNWIGGPEKTYKDILYEITRLKVKFYIFNINFIFT